MTQKPVYPLLTVSGRCRSPFRDHFQSLYAQERHRLPEERERQQRRELRNELLRLR